MLIFINHHQPLIIINPNLVLLYHYYQYTVRLVRIKHFYDFRKNLQIIMDLLLYYQVLI